jgi:hypothetical protein
MPNKGLNTKARMPAGFGKSIQLLPSFSQITSGKGNPYITAFLEIGIPMHVTARPRKNADDYLCEGNFLGDSLVVYNRE